MKPIRFSDHAKLQMLLGGTAEDEVQTAIKSGQWETAKLGKYKTRCRFEYNAISPVNRKFYKSKIVEPIFANEPEELTIVTVKVYYSNEEV
ncbi:MAG: hypothetical protein Q6358_02765 [Candidatus Brocadiales bacterium]|nr:hypothetical protein [Candidatus Brocadiales bacterium]